jgi:PAS domain S-box-containing protein
MEEASFPIIIPAYYLSAGLAFYTAIHSFIFAYNKDRVSLNLSLALISLFVAGVQITIAVYHQAATVVDASLALKFQLIFFFGYVLSTYAFVGIYTSFKKVTPLLILLALFFGALLPLNFYSPNSLRFTTLEAVAPLRMPWGETLRMFSGTPSVWNMVLRFIQFGLLGFIGWRSFVLYQQKKYVSAILLGISSVVFVLSAAWGFLIDLGRIHSFYIGGFAFVFLMILMSISLAEDRKNNILELKHAADLIKRGELELNSIFKAAPVAIALVKNRVFVKVNDFMSEMWGYSREELIGMSVRNFYLSDEDYKRVGNEFYSLVKKNGVAIVEIQSRFKNGRIIDVLLKGAFLDPEDESAGYVIMSLDITDRKTLEKQNLEKEKLESIGILAGGIAHDFNNILTAIVGNVSFAKIKIDSQSSIFKILDEAEKASIRAKGLASQLLTFSKGGQPIKHTASIKGLLNDSIGFVLRGSNVRAKLNIPEDIWAVDIDDGQISQVIQNLVINARQAMLEGGVIDIHAENLIVDESIGLSVKPGRYVNISIRDRGTGISKEDLSKIFVPYYTTKQKGTGLGLAITYSVIMKHEGLITVDSDLGKGTTFNIYLPASLDQNILEKNETVLFRGSGRVLVIDDEKGILDIVHAMLEYLGYNVDVSPSSEEAVLKFQNAKDSGLGFDVVITDLTFPGEISGMELHTRLKVIDPAIKVIVSSGYSNDSVMADFNSFGFSGVIIKPYNISDLSKVLKEVIDK